MENFPAEETGLWSANSTKESFLAVKNDVFENNETEDYLIFK